MRKSEIVEKLQAFPYDSSDYWVITGAAMVLYGLREETHDIDLGCTAAMADKLEEQGYPCRLTPDGKRCFQLGSGIEVFESWLYGTVVFADGIPVISIPGLLEMKRRLGREKDVKDVGLMNEYLKNRNTEESEHVNCGREPEAAL